MIMLIFIMRKREVKKIPADIFNKLIRKWYDNIDNEYEITFYKGAKIEYPSPEMVKLSYGNWSIIIHYWTMILIRTKSYWRF